MKRFTYALLSFALFAVLITGCKKEEDKSGSTDNNTNTEFLAPTTPMNRVAILEDFTGVRCGYCPDGHVRAKAILDANPGKFIILAVHAGSYATPATGWANFTTNFGSALVTQAKVSGFPAGTINRMLCSELNVTPQIANGYAMSRGSWATAANKVMAMSAPVNIGAKATFDAGTRLLTVKVDLYYTSDFTTANNLNVLLLQDHLFSKQSGGTPNSNSYEQNHVVREFLTGQWGEPITETKTTGSKVSKTFTYTVPNDYHGTAVEGGGAVIIDDLKVVAFVANGQTDVLNAVEVDVK
ncbi:MAG: Omp28-related outer membrane protein [Bacteroidia bacterium]|nr:Omp28-related outer membrane protein [Bacteroidia bacterium]